MFTESNDTSISIHHPFPQNTTVPYCAYHYTGLKNSIYPSSSTVVKRYFKMHDDKD